MSYASNNRGHSTQHLFGPKPILQYCLKHKRRKKQNGKELIQERFERRPCPPTPLTFPSYPPSLRALPAHLAVIMGKKKGTKKATKAKKEDVVEEFDGFEELPVEVVIEVSAEAGDDNEEEKSDTSSPKKTKVADGGGITTQPGKEFNYAEVEIRFKTCAKYTFLKKKDNSAIAAVNAYNKLSTNVSGALATDAVQDILYRMLNKSPVGGGKVLSACGGDMLTGCPCFPRNCLDKMCSCTEDIFVMSDSEQEVAVGGPNPSTEPKPMFIGVNQPRGKFLGCCSPSLGMCDETVTFWYLADQEIHPGMESCFGCVYSGHAWIRDSAYPDPFMTSSQPGFCSDGQDPMSKCLPASTNCPTLLDSQADKMTMWKGKVESPFAEAEAHQSQIMGVSHEETCLPCKPSFKLQIAKEESGGLTDWGTMTGPMCWGGLKDMCCIKPFKLEGLDGDLGEIKKRRPRKCGDWFTACCTDDNLYSVRPREASTATEKAFLFGASSQLHKLYFASDGKPFQTRKISDYKGIQCTCCHKFCCGLTAPIFCWCPYQCTSIKSAIPGGQAIDPICMAMEEAGCPAEEIFCKYCCCCCSCCCSGDVDLIGAGMSAMTDLVPGGGW